MKRTFLALCAMGIALSCHAQFYSIGGEKERPAAVTVYNHKTEQTDTIRTETPPAFRSHASDFRQQMVDMWTSVSMPLDRMKVTSPYGMRRHPIYHKSMAHNGIDFGVPVGTKVYAMMDGVINRIGYDSRSGNYVVINHGDYQVSYCHLSKVLVKVGEHVRAGQITCLSGNTGASTGPHLHYGLRDKDGKWCDPSVMLDLVDRTRKAVLDLVSEYGGLASL